MIMQGCRVLGIMATLLLLTAPQTMATTVPQMKFDELVDKTALAFIGTVVESDPTQFDEERNEPVTKVTFLVDEVLKGTPSDDELTFFIPGGMYPDGSYLEYEGSPVFVEDNTYLVFVRDGPWHITPITNWQHSTFRQADVAEQTEEAEGAKKRALKKRVWVDQTGRAVTKVDETGFHVGPRVSLPEQILLRDALLEKSARSAGGVDPSEAEVIQRETARLRDNTVDAPALALREQALAETPSCADCADIDAVLGKVDEMVHARVVATFSAKPESKGSPSGQVMSRAQPLPSLSRDSDETRAPAGDLPKIPGSNIPGSNIPGKFAPGAADDVDVDTFPLEDAE